MLSLSGGRYYPYERDQTSRVGTYFALSLSWLGVLAVVEGYQYNLSYEMIIRIILFESCTTVVVKQILNFLFCVLST
jgi:hypothetical protein